MTPLEAALGYTRRGWRVFPCHTPVGDGCSCRKPCGRDRGKHPRVAHGLKEATTDAGIIRGWWQRWPSANVAIATGPESGLLVVDVDPEKGGDETLAELLARFGPLPATPRVLTGTGGAHYYFRHPGTPVPSRAGILGPGLDVKADDGYVIAPPSLHRLGRRYTWELDVDE